MASKWRLRRGLSAGNRSRRAAPMRRRASAEATTVQPSDPRAPATLARCAAARLVALPTRRASRLARTPAPVVG
eukprot:11170673-Lingulodinium_polyedra.AAC.1